MTINREDLEKLANVLADLVVEKVQNKKHNFWIDGETHYKEHLKTEPLTTEHVQALIRFATAFQRAEGSIIKTVLAGLALCGVIVGAAAWSGISKLWP